MWISAPTVAIAAIDHPYLEILQIAVGLFFHVPRKLT
jgi:hypothetical protein